MSCLSHPVTAADLAASPPSSHLPRETLREAIGRKLAEPRDPNAPESAFAKLLREKLNTVPVDEVQS